MSDTTSTVDGDDHEGVLEAAMCGLWDDDGCTWEARLDPHGRWTVVLEWTDEHGDHEADRATYTWEFHGPDGDDTWDGALARAVEWCSALVAWERAARHDSADDDGDGTATLTSSPRLKPGDSPNTRLGAVDASAPVPPPRRAVVLP